MKRVFITGTDTGIGKTTVGCALASAFHRRGLRVATLKPVETGCSPSAAGLIPHDALRLAEAAGEPLPPARSLDAICPCRFELAVSPAAAAAAAGRPIDLAAIALALTARAGADLIVVEGAGGLLVPLTEQLLIADLAVSLGAPIVIIARAALGTVNHCLLTIEAARARGLRVAGVVLNRTGPPGPDDPTNSAAITGHGAVRVLGTLPLAQSIDAASLGELAERHLDLQGLWQAL